MLTILHRGHDGSEMVFEAKSVTRFPNEGDQAYPPLGEIRASGVDLPGCPCDTITLNIEGPFGAVFVMNKAGATVAKFQ